MSLEAFARDMCALVAQGSISNAIHSTAAAAGSLRYASGVMAQFGIEPEAELLAKMADDLEGVMSGGTALLQKMGEDRMRPNIEDSMVSDPPGDHVRLVFVVDGEEYRIGAHKTLTLFDAAEMALGLAKEGGRIGEDGVWVGRLADGTEVDMKRNVEASGLSEETPITMTRIEAG